VGIEAKISAAKLELIFMIRSGSPALLLSYNKSMDFTSFIKDNDEKKIIIGNKEVPIHLSDSIIRRYHLTRYFAFSSAIYLSTWSMRLLAENM
jgi:hypothetical protein